MKESDYNYWHKLVSTERPDELPNGCERHGSEGWKPETRDPAVWGYLLRRWPKDQRQSPKMRAMTVKECLAMASPNGLVFRNKRDASIVFTCWTNKHVPENHERARIESLNDDGTGGDWQAFEVEA